MLNTRKLPDVIDGIYAAALDPTRWQNVVTDICDFVGGQACGLISKDAISKIGMTHYYCGVDPHFIQTYSETYSQYDPLSILPRYGEVVSIPDLVDYNDYRRGRFCQEWLKPQGCVDAVNVVLERSTFSFPVLMTVLPRKRMMDEDMRRRISLIVPHANRAILINKAIEVKTSEAAAFADVLNGLNAAIYLLDSGCQIVHANRGGQSLLLADDVLRDVRGRLVARDGQVNQSLHLIFATEGDIERATCRKAFALRGNDGQRYVAHVLPLSLVMRGGTERATKAVGALFVRREDLSGQAAGELIARTFDLTPTEMNVFLAIVGVGGAPETAQALGIAVTTVKTHLSRVFAKTGTSRQADLVKLAAEFADPFAG